MAIIYYCHFNLLFRVRQQKNREIQVFPVLRGPLQVGVFLDREGEFFYNKTSYAHLTAARRAEGKTRHGGVFMKGTMSAAEAHKQYTEMVSAYRKLIADPALRVRFGQEVDGYVRRCALGLWQADDASGISQRHVDFYNAVYSPDSSSPSALYWEVATGVAGFKQVETPKFFAHLLEYDRLMATQLSRRFVDQLTLILLMLAAVDDRISEAEAGFVNTCADHLLALCLTEEGARPVLNADQFVTRKQPGTPAAIKQREETVQEEGKTLPPPDLDGVLAELDSLCGLEQVKKDVKSLINLVKVSKLREENGLPVPPMSLHLVFMGNPGTGKTTVARLLAKIYHAIGVLSKGQLVEVDRSGLVAGFVGQTAIKTQEVVQKALGGVLFIDEAYALVNQENGNDFGREAIEVLLKSMEDHRKDLIVIVAGYTNLMEKFIHSNPGLESRFNKYFFFEDYDGAQLMEIFRSMCGKNGYVLTEEAEEWARKNFQKLYENRDENFGNARDVRNRFERAVSRQSDRVAQLDLPTKEQLMQLLREDLKEPEEYSPENI